MKYTKEQFVEMFRNQADVQRFEIEPGLSVTAAEITIVGVMFNERCPMRIENGMIIAVASILSAPLIVASMQGITEPSFESLASWGILNKMKDDKIADIEFYIPGPGLDDLYRRIKKWLDENREAQMQATKVLAAERLTNRIHNN